MLLFDIELVDVEEGLPEGYMFIWNDDVTPDLFVEMDKDNNKEVEPSEVSPVLVPGDEYILRGRYFYVFLCYIFIYRASVKKTTCSPSVSRLMVNMMNVQNKNTIFSKIDYLHVFCFNDEEF